VAVARITVMVQGCDATASLIAAALDLLPELPEDCPADDLLARTVHHRPPVRAIRRVALAPAELGSRAIAAGDRATCDIDAARASDSRAAEPAGDQSATAALTFGYGLRPCPGPARALALAAGVIDAVRLPAMRPLTG
jgi:cytochrome P450